MIGIMKIWRSIMRLMDRIFGDGERTRYYCPCCDTTIGFRRGFWYWNPTIFDVKRYRKTPQKVICPVCGSLPRHRIIASWCEAHMDSLRGKKILVFAPEISMCYFLRQNGIAFLTADLRRIADLKIDIQDTGLARNSFDVIFCNHVLEHVNDLQAALGELHRIISEDGMVICSFPIDWKKAKTIEGSAALTRYEHIKLFGQWDHNRLFGRDSKKILTEAGFRVETIDLSMISPRIRAITGPADYDSNKIFVCKKNS